MERKINLYPYDYNDASFFRGETWDAAVYTWIKRYADTDKYPDKIRIPNEEILKLIESKEGEYHIGSLIDLFCESLTLEQSFAKELRIYDCFDSSCFLAINETGLKLIKCLDGVEFMVYKRKFSNGELDIDLVIFEYGSIDVVINNTLFQGRISQ